MTRTCTICRHEHRYDIDTILVDRSRSYRNIAQQFGVSITAISRHVSNGHISELLALAAGAERAAQADTLLDRIEALQSRTVAILEATEETNEHRTALAAIREARSNLELLAKLLGELDERPVTNILVSAEWATVRTAMMEVLGPYSQARVAVAERLAQLEGQ